MTSPTRRWAVPVAIGYRVGDWEVTDGIASGSWGSVYAGRRVTPPRASTDPPPGSSAALKFLPSGTLTPSQYANLSEITEREIHFSERAMHPRLIRTFETLVVDDPAEPMLNGAVVLVMERAARSLRDVLDAVAGEAGVPDAARLVAEIVEGLAHMHTAGWVHGDLKPSNVLLMEDGSVRLADFGLTGELEGTHAYTPRVGSSDYLPPEWWTERISARGIASRTTGDIWAFGVTAHLLLTGGLFPFPGISTRARTAAAQRYADGDTDLCLADSLPAQWRPIIADCLAPDHASRAPHTAPELFTRIRTITTPARPEPQDATRTTARSGRAKAVALGAIVASIVAGTVGALWITRDGDARLTVYNADVECQPLRTDGCGLSLARDPRAPYQGENRLEKVWHGDELVVECRIDDGTLVVSEDRSSSTRWYRVRRPEGTGWLPGIRVEPGTGPIVPQC
ncbi:MAG: protein kinase domain-containing protein [Egibacteraceae bacterium]